LFEGRANPFFSGRVWGPFAILFPPYLSASSFFAQSPLPVPASFIWSFIFFTPRPSFSLDFPLLQIVPLFFSQSWHVSLLLPPLSVSPFFPSRPALNLGFSISLILEELALPPFLFCKFFGYVPLPPITIPIPLRWEGVLRRIFFSFPFSFLAKRFLTQDSISDDPLPIPHVSTAFSPLSRRTPWMPYLDAPTSPLNFINDTFDTLMSYSREDSRVVTTNLRVLKCAKIQLRPEIFPSARFYPCASIPSFLSRVRLAAALVPTLQAW